MPLSWNEIKTRASAFSKHWQDAKNEDSQAKPFLIDFFEVFGITDKRVATFEHAVKKHGGKDGFVDLFWPGILLDEKQTFTIEAAAQAVLDARAAHPSASLADLYDPLTMPANLLKAHQALDKAVDAAYGYKGANTDAARVAFLFNLYQQITSLLPAEKPKKKKG
jgi:hypothetical protein